LALVSLPSFPTFPEAITATPRLELVLGGRLAAH
jgi:hypothetical protein